MIGTFDEFRWIRDALQLHGRLDVQVKQCAVCVKTYIRMNKKLGCSHL